MFFGILLNIILIQGCAQVTVAEKTASKLELNSMAEQTLAKLIKDNKSLEQELANSVGYMVINWKVTKVPIVGVGGATGVVIDLETKKHIYVIVKRLDLGMGWGVRSFKNLTIFKDKKLFEKVKQGTWKFESGAEVAAGIVAVSGDSSDLSSKYKTYMLLDGGGSATATLRAIKLSPNKNLN